MRRQKPSAPEPVARTPEPAAIRLGFFIAEPVPGAMRHRRTRNLGFRLPPWRVRHIISVVSQASGKHAADILGPHRHTTFCHPRHVAMYILALSRADLSTPQIAGVFGRSDHSSVLHAIQVAQRRIASRAGVSRQVYDDALALLNTIPPLAVS